MIKNPNRRLLLLLAFATSCLITALPTACAHESPLRFHFTIGPGLAELQNGTVAEQALATNFIASFHTAAHLLGEVLFDPATLNFTIDIDDGTLPAGAGAGAIPVFEGFQYAETLQPALVADGKSPDDATSIAFLPLPSPTGIEFMTNDTTQIPSPRFRDDDGSLNNTTLAVTRANAKALGLAPRRDLEQDGSILFLQRLPGGFQWDFDPSDGIGRRRIDFVGLAVHEIGHLLGFFSGVDIVDVFGGDGMEPEGPLVEDMVDLDEGALFMPLDLFRYTDDSLSQPDQPHGGLRDLSFGHPSATDITFFSIDGGATKLATHSSGQFNGDGFQASHWQHDHDLGVMDPVVGIEEVRMLSAFDVLALDVIGWDAVPVPEPGTFALGVLVMINLLLVDKIRR